MVLTVSVNRYHIVIEDITVGDSVNWYHIVIEDITVWEIVLTLSVFTDTNCWCYLSVTLV